MKFGKVMIKIMEKNSYPLTLHHSGQNPKLSVSTGLIINDYIELALVNFTGTATHI